MLDERFNEEELRTLCLYLAVDYDSLGGRGRAANARELIYYLNRRNQLATLVEIGAELRLDIDWSVVREGSHITIRQPFEPEMIFIPAGEFLMGSDPAEDVLARDDEQPQHRLYLPAYYIAKTPLSNDQYLAFVQATECQPPDHWRGGKPPTGQGDHPVTWITWRDAVAYCDWLADATGRPYSLPSEAEWEKAASWDAETEQKRIYPWGGEWDAARCSTSESDIGNTTPVGAYPEGASAYGLLDMAGNVWEWTRSLYRTYLYNATDGREGLGPTGRRILRGGSFVNTRILARCSYRPGYYPDRLRSYGFRVVL